MGRLRKTDTDTVIETLDTTQNTTESEATEMNTHLTFTDKLKKLYELASKQFPVEEHRYKPYSFSRTRDGAWVAFYIDVRKAMERFQSLMANLGLLYAFTLEPVSRDGEYSVKIALTITDADTFQSIHIEEFGWSEVQTEAWKSATTDAYRRVLSAIGIGRYLYSLPRIFISGNFEHGKMEWDFNPLEVLKEVLENPISNTTIFRTKRSGSDNSNGRRNDSLEKWVKVYGCDDEEDLLRFVRSNFNLRSSEKQIKAFLSLTEPEDWGNEDDGYDFTDTDIKRTLDDKLGSRR